jgi:hypothetical protein
MTYPADLHKNQSTTDKSRSSAGAPSSPKSPTSSANAKARLTNEQKKKNHIESEKKRRDAIRAGFDRLADVVPGMQGQGRSEAVVLQHTVAFMHGMIEKRKALDKIAAEKGWTPEQALQPYLSGEKEVHKREKEMQEQMAAKLAELQKAAKRRGL